MGQVQVARHIESVDGVHEICDADARQVALPGTAGGGHLTIVLFSHLDVVQCGFSYLVLWEPATGELSEWKRVR